MLGGLVAGRANKQIAFDLGISPRTVEIYRANLMNKMQAGSLSDLVRMALIARHCGLGVGKRAGWRELSHINAAAPHADHCAAIQRRMRGFRCNRHRQGRSPRRRLARRSSRLSMTIRLCAAR